VDDPLDERTPVEPLRYRPTYPLDRVLVGIFVGGVMIAAALAWAFVAR
jgi:hypothetical protein